jgi:hypothetical protein
MTARPRPALQCAAPTCPPHRGRHTQGCVDAEACRGCLPRLAAPGLQLCDLCAQLLAEDPMTLVVRYHELGRVLAGGGGVLAERVSSDGQDPNLKLNVAASEARDHIRAELVGLVRLVMEERGVHLPVLRAARLRPPGFIGPMPLVSYWDTSVLALGRMLVRHATWLAAHRAADEHAALLRRLVRETYGVAYPSGTRLFPVRVPGSRGVAGCPASVRGFMVDTRGTATITPGLAPCQGSLWTVLRPKDDRLPGEVLCNLVVEHRWAARDWLRKLGPLLAERARKDAAQLSTVERRAA